ncbi:arrestin domain-containing protein 3-like [Acanthaster planci]|uniref:Arrestin domain-containing protein 3-like n=1 Tax=Acanthaster planci TaxID=133434 RepID=A0A8B7YVX6_ACAPL|nr:arrestin domain-containing protein 3-like [Acanthaster planci]XP_022097461.1 arrestin domain-containing protein 3-like [Acanthaster planci]XP_022097462.1 arrestin domain-containing protein 3-like [Acanthaster planci]XP_022097463.1 arrestin domain-containing protein 3-like [Acanthaster planci]
MTGKLQVFEVVFDGDNVDVFRSGDVVKGFIRLVLRGEKGNVRGIKISFKGIAHTHWSEGSDDKRRSYYGHEVYFKENLICLGKGKEDTTATRMCLESGEHHFPFSFQIPNRPLPFPFESHTGWIRYKVSCKIDRPWKFDHRTERLFTVIGIPIDLNAMPNARYPVHRESSNTVCCLCCATGPILTKASTDKSAYVPGESIYISGTVENNSSRDIVNLTVKLIQVVLYLSNGGHRCSRSYTIIKEKAPGCRGGEVARLDWKPLLIPPIPPTGPQGCNIIRIEYVVQFEGDISNTPLDAHVMLPVTIGTVPLHQPMYGDPSAVVINQPSSIDSAPPLPPPPSYEITVGGPQEIPSKSGYDYTFGKLMFAPQYPTYNLPVQPPTWDPAYPPSRASPLTRLATGQSTLLSAR